MSLAVHISSLFSGLQTEALLFFQRPDFRLFAFILIVCAPAIIFVEIQHFRMKRARREAKHKKLAAATFKTYEKRLNYRTWNVNDDLEGAVIWPGETA